MNSEHSELLAGKTTRRSDERSRSDQQLPGKMSLGGKEAQNAGRHVRTLERPPGTIAGDAAWYQVFTPSVSLMRDQKQMERRRASRGHHSNMRVTPAGVARALQVGASIM